MRRRSALAFLALAVLALALVPAPASGASSWLRPVPGRVVRPFRAPLTRFGRGHLGVDFAAAPGAPVRAVGGGRVVFAGTVAQVRHVVVAHAGGLRTSYSFLATIRVQVGVVVQPGAILGTTGGRGENHDGAVLHLGLRIGDTFVDPMRLFEAPKGIERVHLAPVLLGGPSGSNPARAEIRALAVGLGETAPLVLPAPRRPGPDRQAAIEACGSWIAAWCRWLSRLAIRPG